MNTIPRLGIDLNLLIQFLVSLGIGLLIGLERQRRATAKAGLRTCALVALFGNITGLLAQATQSPWIVAAGLLAVGAMIIIAYLEDTGHPEADSGTTTVIAVLLCYVFGVMVWYGYEQLAAILGIATTLLLHFRAELHGISERLSTGDINSMLQFAVLSLIVLPLLPDHGYGWHNVINPYQLWLMVVLISGVSLSGYLMLKIAGAKRSLWIIGLFGGLVSSTATTVVQARQAAQQRELLPLSAAVIGMANLMVPIRLAVLAAAVAPGLLSRILPVLAAGVLCGLWPVMLRARAAADLHPRTPDLSNPTQLRVALGFGALYAAILFASAWLLDVAGTHGLYAVALVSGVADIDAITLSGLQLFNTGSITGHTAAITLVVAYLSSATFKLCMSAALGGKALAGHCWLPLAAPALGMAAGLLLFAP